MRLEVAVNDPKRMHHRERLRDLLGQEHALRDGQRSREESRSQALPIKPIKRQKDRSGRGLAVRHIRYDAWVIQGLQVLRLAPECALMVQRLVLPMQELDGHMFLRLLIKRLVHKAVAAATDLIYNQEPVCDQH